MKYQVINVEKELVLAKGNYEGIGFSEDLPDHTTAFHLMKEKLTNGEEKVWHSRYYDDCRNDGHQFRNCNGDWYGYIAFPSSIFIRLCWY